jgi:HEAT repeat protein
MTQETAMTSFAKTFLVGAVLFFASNVAAQNDSNSDTEQLKIAAMEALISAPPERALPLVNKVLDGNSSDELKERALFILSQIDRPEAQETLLRFARESTGELQEEAIRMVGIGGNRDAQVALKTIYESGNTDTREAVLEALMIAGNKQAVFEIALTATGEDYENAVDMLGVMNARDQLRELRKRNGASEALIEAHAISGDFDELREMALDGSNPKIQAEAIQAMGIVGGDRANATLVQIYRDATTDEIREAALDGMLISGDDNGVLDLYRTTDDPALKKEMLKMLVIMGSDEVWSIIDSALDGGL